MLLIDHHQASTPIMTADLLQFAGVEPSGVCYTVPRRKDISEDIRGVIVAAHQPVKGYKVISKQFWVHHA